MAVTTNSIVTPQTPKTSTVNAATAQATFPPTTSPSNTVLAATAGANGGRVVRVEGCPQETTTANNLQLYRDNGTAGVSKYLVRQVTLTSTVSASAAASNGDFGFSETSPLLLQANERLYVAVGVAKSVNFVVDWADY